MNFWRGIRSRQLFVTLIHDVRGATLVASKQPKRREPEDHDPDDRDDPSLIERRAGSAAWLVNALRLRTEPRSNSARLFINRLYSGAALRRTESHQDEFSDPY